MCDEELAASGIFSGESHAESATKVGSGIDLAADLIAGATLAITAWITTLNDKIGDDTVKGGAVKVVASGECKQVFDRLRSIAAEEIELDTPLFGSDYCGYRLIEALGKSQIVFGRMAGSDDADARGDIHGTALVQQINGESSDEVIRIAKRGLDRSGRRRLTVSGNGSKYGKPRVGYVIIERAAICVNQNLKSCRSGRSRYKFSRGGANDRIAMLHRFTQNSRQDKRFQLRKGAKYLRTGSRVERLASPEPEQNLATLRVTDYRQRADKITNPTIPTRLFDQPVDPLTAGARQLFRPEDGNGGLDFRTRTNPNKTSQ